MSTTPPNPQHNEQTMLTIVRQAWMETLPDQAFDPNQSWEEAGGDSLASLHILLRLEKALGRRLTFDVLNPFTTAADLARALEEHREHAGDPSAPRVFLLPGIFGDEPLPADFRRSFAGRILFQVVDLPDIGQPASVLTDLAATARQVACEIARRQPSGSILIAGFSFGGTVAFEAASHLISEGREIRFLGLLDAVVDVPMFGALPGRKNLPRTLPSRAQNKCLVLTLRLLTAWLGGRRLVLAALRQLSLNAFIRLRNHILWDCRLRALRGWHARSPTTSAKGMRVLLAVSEEFAPAAIAVWQQLCPGMFVVQLPGGHLDVLRTSSLPKLAPAFEDLILRDEV